MGDNSGQCDLSELSNTSESSVNISSGGSEKELVALEKFDDCSPNKKIKIENGVCSPPVLSNENEACPSSSAKTSKRGRPWKLKKEAEKGVGNLETTSENGACPSSSANTSKRGRPRKLKKEAEKEKGVRNLETTSKIEVTHSNTELKKNDSCEDLSVIPDEKHPSHLPDLDKSQIKVGSSTCLYGAGEIDISQSSSSKEVMAAVKQDDAVPSTSKMWKRRNQEFSDSASSSESEWEEVEEHEEPSLDDYKPDIPKEGVEITLENPLLKKRYKRKKFDFDGYVRLHINRFKKDVQLALHKVHLLCLLGHGLCLNEILNSCEIQALALSLLPEELISVAKNRNKIDIAAVSKVVGWFCSTFTIDLNSKPSNNSLQQQLVASFETQKAADSSKHNVIFVAFARALGISVRLCYSLHPLTFKAKDLLKKPKAKNSEANSEDDEAPCESKKLKIDRKINASESSQPPSVKSSDQKKKHCKSSEPSAAKGHKRKSAAQRILQKKGSKRNKSQSAKTQNKPSSRRPRRSKQNKSYKISSDENEDCDDSDADADFCVGDEEAGGADSEEEDFVAVSESESDSDCVPSTIVVTVPQRKSCEKQTVKSALPDKRNSSNSIKKSDRKGKTINRKILSSDSEESSYEGEEDGIHGIEFWSEIYSQNEKRWIPVETTTKLIDRPYEIETVARQPVTYVVVFDNKSHIKDVTKRYCSQFLTVTRKLQPDPEWWEETLEPFLPPNNKQNKEEDQQILENLCNRPLPTTMTEVKNHPLYIIKPHLLKYEALYPPDAAPVGYIRGEPIYSRDCVVTLHNREKWHKEARVVREGEKPYKMVKSRPKWDKVNRRIIKTEELPLVEVFGYWQTDQFVPPTAQDGKVPRNEYGNVELFQPSMLPKGTVHLQIPGLNRIARKLDIDCAPALTGFDVHNLGIHPVFDGWIVCKEFKKTLLDAWDEEQENIRIREQEKREKRIYGNWKKLIKGVLIRERIRVKYALK